MMRYTKMTLRPSPLFWLSRWLLPLAGAGALLWLSMAGRLAIRGADCSLPALAVAAIVIVIALYRLIRECLFTTWEITDEVIVIKEGIISRRRNYTVLYRIVDFELKRSPVDLLFGTWTLVVHSTDKTDPHLRIYGIQHGDKVLDTLREKVEEQRRVKGIKEFTNGGSYNEL